MPVPTYEELLQPTLEAVRQLGGLQSITAINKQIVSSLALTPEEISQPHGDTRQTELEYRLAWARTYLKHYGLIENPKRGVWMLTEQGRATEHVDPRTVSMFVQELIKQGKVDSEKPADGIDGQTAVDLAQRLAQWRLEATDLGHSNYVHADLDQAARIYAKITALFEKLRNLPDAFSRDDVVDLFGALNSGPRMKNKVANENALPLLRETLLALVDGPGTAAEKIAAAAQTLKYAGPNTLGELYGWCNAGTAPLYNGCAIAALHHLGYTFKDNDYTAFVAAHEQFKQTYQQQVGQLRPDLPMNLEIDKLYNVIDKVDLKQGEQRTLAMPFSEMFANLEEANAVFDALAEAARQLGVTDPTDERIAVNLRYKEGKHQLRLSYGWWLVLGFAGSSGTLQQTFLALLSEQAPLQPLRVETFKQGSDEQPVSLNWYLAAAVSPFEGEIGVVFEATLRHIKTKFAHWSRCPYRVHTKDAILTAVFDSTARTQLLTQGWPPKGVLLDSVTIESIDELKALDDPPSEDELDVEPATPYNRQNFLARTYLLHEQAEALYDLLLDKRQIILYGPPGTGKTYVAQELAKWIIGLAQPSANRTEMIQFHPAYSYEDFIEGIRPESKATSDGRFMVDYPPRPGVFRRFCKLALENPDQPHVFIIDEINRGNIPRIFGELMLLLEYRERDVQLPYSGERFRIPHNVYLIGTMNTADRSIALVDFALRRRFHFFQFRADPDLLERWLAAHPLPVSYLAKLYRRLSQEAIDDPDYAVGVSYFMDPEMTEIKLARVWRYSILPYLVEYHIEQRTRTKNWEWESDFMRAIRSEM